MNYSNEGMRIVAIPGDSSNKKEPGSSICVLDTKAVESNLESNHHVTRIGALSAIVRSPDSHLTGINADVSDCPRLGTTVTPFSQKRTPFLVVGCALCATNPPS